MEITLNSKEINKALISYVTHQFNLKIDPTHNIQIEYKAGRGENGPTASIIIDEVGSTPDVIKTEEPVENITKTLEPLVQEYSHQPETSNTSYIEPNDDDEEDEL